MKEILLQYAMQMVWVLGVLLLLGVILELATRRFLANTGKGGRVLFIATGIVGTPIHELSHVMMCLLFGHRILKVRLFAPDLRTGTLGYVEHAYTKSNVYKRAGNFFIGIAPMLGGIAAILALIYFLCPDLFATLGGQMAVLYDGGFSPFAPDTYRTLFEVIGKVLATLFAPENFANPMWWAFFLPAIMIALHMDISPADLRTALVGFWVFALLLLSADAALYAVAPEMLQNFTGLCLFAATFVLVLSLPAVILLLLALLISFCFRPKEKYAVQKHS